MQDRILVVKISGMHCQGCADSIAKELNSSNGIGKATVEFSTGKAKIVFDPEKTDEERIGKKIMDTGFGVL